jgi:hypothetical protein
MVQRKASIPCAPLETIGGHYGSTHMDELGQKFKVVFVYGCYAKFLLAITICVPIFCLRLNHYP